MVDFDGFDRFAAELDEFADSLDEIADDLIEDAIDDGVRTTALQVEASASRRAPVESGDLRADLKALRLRQALYSVGSTKKYAPSTEYGSKPHPITPNGPYPLVFEARDGTIVATNHVDHPGTPPQPFLRPALNEHRSDLVDNISDEIRKLIEKHL